MRGEGVGGRGFEQIVAAVVVARTCTCTSNDTTHTHTFAFDNAFGWYIKVRLACDDSRHHCSLDKYGRFRVAAIANTKFSGCSGGGRNTGTCVGNRERA